MNRKERRAAGRQGGSEAASLLASAVRHHQAGQLAEAEAFYRRVLAIDRRHARALYYLGVLCANTRRLQPAIDLFEQAARLDPHNPELRYNLAAVLQGAGRFDDAVTQYRRAITLKPGYVDAHMNLGNALADLGQLPEAIACYDGVLALDARSAVAHYNAANLLARAGDFDAAIARYREAIRLQPDLAEAHNNLGNALRSQDRLPEAEASYRHALGLKPDYADAHNNLGIVLTTLGATEEGIAHYERALQARPGFAEAQNNVGLALFRAGRPEAAVVHFEKALALDPRYIDAYINLARQLYAAGDVEQAVAVAARGVAAQATPDAKDLFARYVGALDGATLTEPYRDAIISALVEGWTRTSDLERVSVLLIKETAAIARAMSAAASAPPTLDLACLAAIADDRLLHGLMTSARVGDPDLERMLTAARRVLLDAAGQASAALTTQMLAFACALARQCFINEYVFAEDAREEAIVRELVEALGGQLLSGVDVDVAPLIAVACYRPLHALSAADHLLDRAWPECVREVLDQQVREPRLEREIRASMPSLTSIDDEVSRKVRDQYEENPYPRWIAPAPQIKCYPVGEYFRAKFPLAPLRPIGAARGADILVAGCGTGAHAIETFRKIAGARVLAIDLSRASLAYAVRKTRSLGLPIEFAQADILKLGGIGRTFDVIESSGVLHHLADPFAGWRVLLSLLRPGGVMAIGLYSRLARAEINAARTFLAERGYRPSPSDIRRCRQELLSFPPGAPGHTVTRLGDFYSMSECRDLLFHVQEHQHTLPEIAAFLAENRLQFLAFKLDARVLTRYAQDNSDDPAMTDLARWHVFECAHPGVFSAMYQFAVQKL